MGTPTVLLSLLTHPRLPLPRLLILDSSDTSSLSAMLDIPTPMLLDTHTDLLPMPTELLSLLMSPLSMPLRLLMLPLEELSTPLESTVLLMPVLLPTPMVLLSQLSPLMLLPPVLSILLLLHLLKNHLVC